MMSNQESKTKIFIFVYKRIIIKKRITTTNERIRKSQTKTKQNKTKNNKSIIEYAARIHNPHGNLR